MPVAGTLRPREPAPTRVTLEPTVALDALEQTLTVPARLLRPTTVAYRSDLSGSIVSPSRQTASKADLQQRMALIRARQAEYDRYNALPRRLPNRGWSEAEFAAHLDDVMGDNEAKRTATLKVKLKEAMEEQVAERRHQQWTRQVYLPIANSVAAGVDASFASIHRERLAAYEGYLKASDPENASRGLVFLGGNTAGGAAGYNPWALNAHATVRARVAVQDPLKTVLTKRAQEAVLLGSSSAGGGGGGGAASPRQPTGRAGVHEVMDRSPQRLHPSGWVLGNLETQPFGHFEVKELRAGGTLDMAFAGKDTASTWRGYDFDGKESFGETGPVGRAGSGRVREVDAEFPVGKRFEVNPRAAPGVLYPQRSSLQESYRVATHRVSGRVYDYRGSGGSDGVFTDAPLLDAVRPAVTGGPAAVLSKPQEEGFAVPHSTLVGRNRYGQAAFPKQIGEQLGSTYRRPAEVRPVEAEVTGFAQPRGLVGRTLSTQSGMLNFNHTLSGER
jgi:hypothetical protein